jgi:hypothetical protein
MGSIRLLRCSLNEVSIHGTAQWFSNWPPQGKGMVERLVATGGRPRWATASAWSRNMRDHRPQLLGLHARVRLRRSNGGTLMERLAQCHCGSLRAVTSGEPSLVNLCHCKACQRRTGALASTGAAFAKAQVTIEGPRKVFERDGQSVGRFASISAPTVEHRCIGSLMSDRTCTSWRSARSPIRTSLRHRRQYSRKQSTLGRSFRMA